MEIRDKAKHKRKRKTNHKTYKLSALALLVLVHQFPPANRIFLLEFFL
jgi:hypothetical protein